MMDRTLLEMVGLWSSSVPPPTHTVKRLAPTEGCCRLQWGLHLSLCQHEDPSCAQSSRQLWGKPQLQCLNGRAAFQGQLKVTFTVYMYMLGLCFFFGGKYVINMKEAITEAKFILIEILLPVIFVRSLMRLFNLYFIKHMPVSLFLQFNNCFFFCVLTLTNLLSANQSKRLCKVSKCFLHV